MLMNTRNFLHAIGCIVLPALAGCSSSLPPLPIPKINAAAGTDAVRQYDTNGDQAIDLTELKRSPALHAALPRLDQNKDSRLTAEEIDRRLDVFRNSGVGMTTCTIIVRMHGQPVEGAAVKMIPEEFLGEQIKPTQGVTNRRGMARMKAGDEVDGPGAHLGLYRVEISKVVDGKETIPAKYNAQSQLGLELAADVFESRGPIFDLQSK